MKYKFMAIVCCFLVCFSLLFTACGPAENETDKHIGLKVATNPLSTVFCEGEDFSTKGIDVYMEYSDTNKTLVTDYDVDSSNYDKNQSGDYTIKIQWLDTASNMTYKTTYNVSVKSCNDYFLWLYDTLTTQSLDWITNYYMSNSNGSAQYQEKNYCYIKHSMVEYWVVNSEVYKYTKSDSTSTKSIYTSYEEALKSITMIPRTIYSSLQEIYCIELENLKHITDDDYIIERSDTELIIKLYNYQRSEYHFDVDTCKLNIINENYLSNMCTAFKLFNTDATKLPSRLIKVPDLDWNGNK